MIFMLLMAGAAVNVALCVIAGGVVFVGGVFFLIGLPASKSSKKWLSPDLIKFALTVFLTLLTLIIYMVITFWSARTGGTLAFSRSVPTNAYMDQAKNLILLGGVQGAFSLLAFKWLLPGLIGELGLSKKHIWGISAGGIVTIAGGSVAWLASM
ncbi:hypothetical protein [Brevibacillus laterosporus]|uniref:hypothetical protein n=1 Tax=Brevibacillus laterosporus TaxID=1465 RepID=UPI002651B84C|nr:hypothetical protein [Brevibacillus laterosporus]MDN9009396.1 hypothetical protein [Brevibacillus laterosporus]MDO0940165.1 hypothetical protein [Brevibacillus laterosporus]